jgi:hypothetical protein
MATGLDYENKAISIMEPKPKPSRKKGRPPEGAGPRVVVIVLKDTAEYRDWVVGLSEATLIPTATIVRNALANWAAERGLPAPPSRPSRRRLRGQK